MCMNANDVTDDVIGKHMVGERGNHLTIYHVISTLKWLKLCKVALHIHILPGSIQSDMSSVTFNSF